MKICLVTQHCRPTFIPLALLYLKACLVERHKCAEDDVTVVECGPEATEDEILDRVLANGASVIGMSCYVWNVNRLMAVGRRLNIARRLGQPLRTILARGGQDGAAGQQARSGARAAGIVVGTRYIHTVTEMIDLGDLAAARDLLAAWAKSVD